MDLMEFVEGLHAMSEDDITGAARAIVAERASVANEVTWLEAVSDIDRLLRHDRRGRLAAEGAHLATTAVVAAAQRSRATLPDAQVTKVARTAAHVARAIVAGDAGQESAGRLLACWSRYVPRPALMAFAVAS